MCQLIWMVECVAGREVLTVRCNSSSPNQAIGGGEAVQFALSMSAPSESDLACDLVRTGERSGMVSFSVTLAVRLAVCTRRADGKSKETRTGLTQGGSPRSRSGASVKGLGPSKEGK